MRVFKCDRCGATYHYRNSAEPVGVCTKKDLTSETKKCDGNLIEVTTNEDLAKKMLINK